MDPSNISFLSFRVIFHFHDYGRKGSGLVHHPIDSQPFKTGNGFRVSGWSALDGKDRQLF